jgi:hypothetical protein
LVSFVGAAALSCVTALWPGYAADFSDLIQMALVSFFLINSAPRNSACGDVDHAHRPFSSRWHS